jgi:hypothetical protein
MPYTAGNALAGAVTIRVARPVAPAASCSVDADQSYTIELTSMDYCANKGTFRHVVTMPSASPEGNAAIVSGLSTIRVGFLNSYFSQLHFSATDDTGIDRVAKYINGTLLTAYRYFDGVRFRWRCDPYTLDSVQSTLEGPNFYVSYPDGYKGVLATVEVVVEDLSRNKTRSSAQLLL